MLDSCDASKDRRGDFVELHLPFVYCIVDEIEESVELRAIQSNLESDRTEREEQRGIREEERTSESKPLLLQHRQDTG